MRERERERDTACITKRLLQLLTAQLILILLPVLNTDHETSQKYQWMEEKTRQKVWMRLQSEIAEHTETGN